jgi:hypothetical protein
MLQGEAFSDKDNLQAQHARESVRKQQRLLEEKQELEERNKDMKLTAEEERILKDKMKKAEKEIKRFAKE